MNNGPRDDRSLRDLFGELVRDVTSLVGKEITLARRETSEKLVQIGIGLAALGIGALLAFVGLLVLLDALVLKLAERMNPALAALIAGGIVAAVGIFLLLRGKANLSAGNLVPSRTAQSLRRDTELIKDRVT